MAEITPELDERLAQFLRGDYAQSLLKQGTTVVDVLALITALTTRVTTLEGGTILDPPRCRLYNTGNQTVNTSLSPVLFDSEDFDTDGMHSTSSNTGRITPQTSGLYWVGAGARVDNHTTTYTQIALNHYDSSRTLIEAPALTRQAANSTGVNILTVATIWECDASAGEFFEVALSHGAGTSETLFGDTSAGRYTPWFAATWLAPIAS